MLKAAKLYSARHLCRQIAVLVNVRSDVDFRRKNGSCNYFFRFISCDNIMKIPMILVVQICQDSTYYGIRTCPSTVFQFQPDVIVISCLHI